MNKKYERALKFATQKHHGQFRIGGEEYITHPIAVAEIVRNQGYGLEYQITALFHDLLEDTDATEDDIVLYGDQRILDAVKALTKPNGYIMSEYISGVKQNEIAYVVKTADRIHNLKCAVVTNDAFKKKYIRETMDWYLDFSDEIPNLVKLLSESMDRGE